MFISLLSGNALLHKLCRVLFVFLELELVPDVRCRTLGDSVQNICVIPLIFEENMQWPQKLELCGIKWEHERIDICNFAGMIRLPAAQLSRHL